ncbi:30S ribosomal protein S16 [candidate division WWE3 bacterium RIFCSPHIGHO2_01_FULL_42_13]|uniref:Small ribosomal subunit protein bS16 n=1 Tax=candidate division WWE3 bacterium RIFCSPHIGHO2_01_FULL_42_13 TaxID=1802617 RepID=A0A1F4URU1_UNCKA|nr:MAG: 30S ribosomal protein S16 [candidate division WWE3 bacterium RIFCSPHIGHO2_01_FULL_42_13]
MSVTIRLAQIGKTNSPAFKVVVSNTRDKRNGKFLDILGHYNPSNNPVLLEIDKKKYEEWKGKGAMVTSAVEQLVEGKYEFTPYTRQNEGEAATAATPAPTVPSAPEEPASETASSPEPESAKE